MAKIRGAKDRGNGRARQNKEARRKDPIARLRARQNKDRAAIRAAGPAMPRVPKGVWVLEEQRGPSELALRKAAIRKFLGSRDNQGGRGSRPEPAPPDRHERIRFHYRPTGERLVLAPEGKEWIMEWRGQARPLTSAADIETTDGVTWIVEPPYVSPQGSQTIGHPRKARPGLSQTLAAWVEAMSGYASPELAHERIQAASVAQILRALAEAVRRNDLAAKVFRYRTPTGATGVLNLMDGLAGSYLKTLWFEESDRPATRLGQEGLRVKAARPAAAEALAQHWLHYLPPKATGKQSAEAVAHEFIRDLRTGSYYAEVARELPNLMSAGAKEVEQIARHYDRARSALLLQPKDSLETARSLVRKAAAVLGHRKARSLFDAERAKEEREIGARSRERTRPRAKDAPP